MKILVSDFDNTFYTQKIEENVKLVNQFREKGNVFIIATGRPLYLLKSDLEKYGVQYDYLICNDGAVIFDEQQNIIDKTNIDYQTTIDIFNVLKRDKNMKHVYVDSIYDFGDLEAKDFNGILALPYDKELAQEKIQKIMLKYSTIHGYLSHKWLNILSIDASKGNAISFLKNKNNWNQEDIYVIGDNKNDLSMLAFENSYAVLNGSKEFIDKCNYKVEDFSKIMEIL